MAIAPSRGRDRSAGWLREVLRRSHTMSLVGVSLEMGLGLVGSVLVARLLLPDARGELARWIYWSGVAIGLSTVGMSTAIPQMVGARRLSIGDARALFTLLAGALGLGSCVLGWLLTPLACTGNTSRSGWYWMIGCNLPGAVVAAVGYGIHVSTEQIRALMSTRVAGIVLRVLALAVLLSARIRNVTLIAVVFSLTSAATGLTLAALARPTLPDKASLRSLSPILARGGAIHVPALVGIAMGLLNQGWVYTRLSNTDGGLYAVAAGAAATLQVVSLAELAASTVVMSDPERGWWGVRIALRRSAVLSGLGVAGGVVLAPFVLPLVYGRAYAPAVPVFCVLLGGIGTENIVNVGRTALQSLGFPANAWLADATRAATLIGCMIGFGTRTGTMGVAISTLLAQLAGLAASAGALLVVRQRTLNRAA